MMEDPPFKRHIILWLIERYQALRGTATHRAAIVVSANAVLLAGLTFMIDKHFSNSSNVLVGRELFVFLSMTSMVLLLSSIAFACHALANIWSTSRDMFTRNLPTRTYFHPQDTMDKFEDFPTFSAALQNDSEQDILGAAKADLWALIAQHNYGYGKLRIAIRLLVFGIVPYTLAIIILVLRLY